MIHTYIHISMRKGDWEGGGRAGACENHDGKWFYVCILDGPVREV